MVKKADGEASKGSSNGNGSKGSPLSLLKSVYEFMSQNNLESLEIDEKELHLKLVRRKALQPAAIPVPVMVQGTTGGSPSAQNPTTASLGTAQSMSPPALPAGTSIKSPMMGIFYRAPSPSSPPFVKDGEAVRAGQVICMIEAMKVFNEIKAEYPCTVVKVLLENGKPVKSGQDIFIVQR